ncbi:AP2/ERF and B3 domain-containing transcription factor At1g51120-like [Dioscorea cayenensis subsp. rotundata]|uniref:AP2/ERF and B3 domain-containing transcription factor At1g51120-like n=1 Tax=Dioscorea cayennensis subsp. rotundata TaxID=55577 RepID=A0AB40BE48_DIOCR|nr:AP2/ERF and B3 domain-containing transcription factor At1g51120-like [Dioscorea cayenensis subsp. rotundata]
METKLSFTLTGQEEAETSTRFKGVVLQQNGHWGAQIYTNHTRIWLGTFKTERAAAMAYDSAAIKLHRSNAHRNFPWNELTSLEPHFQELFTTEAVLAMIRDGSYENRFSEFLHFMRNSKLKSKTMLGGSFGKDGVKCVELFDKELTPSDVGKLNRLVVPKKHAVQYFPVMMEGSVEEMMLEFRDREDGVWMFRYCYWKSSQSYVFTKGWNKFVKEKGLRAKDVIVFYRCEERGERGERSYCMIDVVKHGGDGDVELELGLKMEEEEEEEEEEKKVVKLFGACIS